MRLSVIRTGSGSRRHPTLLARSARWTAFAWAHRLERPWWFRDTGILCFGIGFLSFNIFSSQATQ